MEIKDRILIVEDDQSIINLLTAILKANSYQTMTAKTGAEAETLLTSWCPDMVILDLGLPDFDGITVLKNLRSWSSMPVGGLRPHTRAGQGGSSGHGGG